MQLNSVVGGALTGLFIALVLALGFFSLIGEVTPSEPRTDLDAHSSEQILPYEAEAPILASELARVNYLSRINALRGDTEPDPDFSGNVEAAAVADRERTLARTWCISRLATHSGMPEQEAAKLIAEAERGHLNSGIHVLDALEAGDQSAEGRVRAVQCAEILYLGFYAIP
jgi:hypothetical protein